MLPPLAVEEAGRLEEGGLRLFVLGLEVLVEVVLEDLALADLLAAVGAEELAGVVDQVEELLAAAAEPTS